MTAQVNAQLVEAFEINNIANDVYQHNFGHRPYQVCSFFPLTEIAYHLLHSELSFEL